jgi:protein-disulfide isomerase
MSRRATLQPPITDADHTRGAETSEVTITMFGDFECGYSARADELLQNAIRELAGQVRIAYRHFPVEQLHPHAMLAAEAAEAASARGHYWAMHDQLFAHRSALTFDDLLHYGAVVGVDPGALANELRDGAFVGQVRSHQRSGASSGVVTAPSMFLNGIRLELTHLDALRGAVDDALRPTNAQHGHR